MLKYGANTLQISATNSIDPAFEGKQDPAAPCLNEFAYQVVAQQFQYILDQEAGVIADADPEYLHQMRVGFRKLQGATAIFTDVIKLPSNFKLQDCKRILKTLGGLRDLDVQILGLTRKIKKASTPGSQRRLTYLQRDLKRDRRKAYKQVYKTLCKTPSYANFKRQLKGWLKHPQYHAIATLPVKYCVPDLFSPLMAKLLLHPAWLISPAAMTPVQLRTLHHLRKLCKQLRYQGEFFQGFYPNEFKIWLREIKAIQSALGQLQDACVFEQLIHRYQTKSISKEKAAIASKPHSPDNNLIHDTGLASEWESFKQRYCDLNYRRQLHELILSPLA